ncbi:MAG: hypothetical protein KDE31_27585, partial [Caldilineaceae bacterium]|nr:hypothetical protein [Caldilineaceae bacterium]
MLVTTAACPPYGNETPATCPLYPSPHLRMGFNVAREGGVSIDDYDVAQLHAGWYLDYNRQHTPSHPAGMIYHQMLRSEIDTTRLDTSIGGLVDANPGTIWVVGNEPDRTGQDEMTPAEFATFYHDVYTFLKAHDQNSRVAVGAIVQPTPLRLRYLDMVLVAYESQYGTKLPTDIWTIHNFLLPERCTWGAHIPLGLEEFADEGIPCLTPLSKHADSTTFQQRIRDFRQWMSVNGYRNSPLIVSEYGVLLSPAHGFPYPVVRDYMLASFDFMLNTTDKDFGYPADGNRLVQQFAWFSLNYWEFDINTYFGLNGNLFDHDSAQITPLGRDFAAYTRAKTVRTIDLAITAFQASATTVDTQTPLIFDTTFVNQGGVAAENVTLQLWDGNPQAGGTLVGATSPIPQVLTGCYDPIHLQQQWTP